MLLVQDAEDFRQLTAQFLAIEWPNAEVDEWAPRSCGELPDFFPLDAYDVLLLDHDLGLGNGLEWLIRLVQRKDCPPVVLFVDTPHKNSAGKALRYGAFAALPKRGLTRARLARVVRAAAATRSARASHGNSRHTKTDSGMLSLDSSQTEPVDAPLHRPHEVEISGYRMLEKIGSGGMATVYLAERTSDHLRLVMKIMNERLTEESEFLKRFIQEYGLVSRINCPQVVRIYDQGVTDQHVYIAMEHFGDGDLRARIRNGLDANEALDILENIARGLSAVHAHGIVHRDLKPDNVMFRSGGTLAIVDFGIATKQLGGVDLTDQGDVLGTPHYLSPEQARGRPLDGRSDLYSLGIVFFEMLTGRRPFRAKDAVGLAQKHVNQPLPRLPSEMARYQELMDCLTAKRVEDRFATAGELIAYVQASKVALQGAVQLGARAAAATGAVNENVSPARVSRSRVRTSSSRSPSTAKEVARQPHADPADTLLNTRPMLARIDDDPVRLEELKQAFTRTVQPVLILVADAIDDRNFPFIYHATLLLKDIVGRTDAPVVAASVGELEARAMQRDIGETTSAFSTTHGLVRRLMTELARVTL